QRQRDLANGQAMNLSRPKVVVENCIALIDQVLNTNQDDLFYLDPVRSNEAYFNKTKRLIDNAIIPAYVDFKNFLQEEYLRKAPTNIGIREVANGQEIYKQRVAFFTTLDISPEEIFQIGKKEVERILNEMHSILDSLEFEGSIQDFINYLRTDPQFYAKTGEELLYKAAWITKRIEGELPKYFNKIPRVPLTVEPVPDAIAPKYTSGRYSPGSMAREKAGAYLVNTYKLESRPLYALPALTLHEGVPGHHLQIMLAAEIKDLPEFRRQTYLSAFGEGWGLYAEYLGKEAGIYETPYEDFGRLTYEMWRACRLVVDPGMHYMGWTKEEAIQFMADHTALSMHEIKTEIDRYIGWPGQAVSYKMGEIKIRELRLKAEKELAEKFDLKEFHDLVLSNGSIPLRTLERVVHNWIKSK
ncbi:MAG: DUF885 domain-containing protein, partial [Bacteroidota bacterium]